MRSDPTVLMLADDLTGAADCAARWRVTGWPATVQLMPTATVSTGATAFISDSRHLTPTQAAQAVHSVLAQLSPLRNQRWYKKIDSTLRGNLGAELDAMLQAVCRTHALICPAFPAQRRGLQYGRLVCDPTIAPALDLPDLLAQQSQRPIALVTLDHIRAGPASLANSILVGAQQASLIVCDATTDADLAALVEAALHVLPDALLCGSAGLLGALAARSVAPLHVAAPDAHVQRVLIVVGSGSGMAHRQLDELHHRYHVRRVNEDTNADRSAIGPIALVHLPPPPANTILDSPQARSSAQQLSMIACQWIDRINPDLLIVVGGDTAMALFTQLAISELRIERELLPGISLSQAVAHSGKQYQLILKAGSFGEPTVLADLLDAYADLRSVRRIR